MDTLCRLYQVGNTFRGRGSGTDTNDGSELPANYRQVKLIPHISFLNFGERNRMSKSLTAELSRLLTLQA